MLQLLPCWFVFCLLWFWFRVYGLRFGLVLFGLVSVLFGDLLGLAWIG